MIHFRCGCGATLSVGEERAGGPVWCSHCGSAVTVPQVPEGGGRPPRRDTPPHDFDAEIVTAARTRPPRRVKTPEDRKAPAPSPERPPDYDLRRVRRAPRTLRMVAGGGVLALVAGGVLVLLLGPWTLPWRAGAASLLLVLAALLAAGLAALGEVCRALVGLAERQREIAVRVEEARREVPGKPAG